MISETTRQLLRDIRIAELPRRAVGGVAWRVARLSATGYGPATPGTVGEVAMLIAERPSNDLPASRQRPAAPGTTIPEVTWEAFRIDPTPFALQVDDVLVSVAQPALAFRLIGITNRGIGDEWAVTPTAAPDTRAPVLRLAGGGRLILAGGGRLVLAGDMP